MAGLRRLRRRNAVTRRRSAALASACAILCAAIAVSAATPALALTSEQRAASRLVGIAPSTPLGSLEYARMQIGGVRHLRVPMFWEDLQPTAHGYDFTKSDTAATYAAYYGMRLHPFVM